MSRSKRAIVFTLDALLAIPIMLTLLGTLVVFAATFRENVLAHEYAYIAARDTMARLAELKVKEYEGAGGVLATDKSEKSLSIAELIGKRAAEGKVEEARKIFEAFFAYPHGYTLEFFNATTLPGKWETIASREKDYKFEVPYLHIVSARTDPTIEPLANCPAQVACALPTSRYTTGKLIGPTILRLRVRA